MSALRERVESALRRLAADPQGDDFMAVGRVQTAGEPVLWQETIAFERGGLQTFFRTRSTADEGGAAIGRWSMPADDWRAHVFASALERVGFWTRDSDTELLPGMEIVEWCCVTTQGILDLTAAGSSALVPEMAPLDLELRRLANDLEGSRQGASLRVAMQVQPVGGQLEVRVGLVNDGNRPCVVVNPFASQTTPLDYFRLELAPLPPEEPEVTGLGAEFAALPQALMAPRPPAPWNDTYLMLVPGYALVLPTTVKIGPFEPGPYLLRAVYSGYGLLDAVAGVPAIRGRAFSNEAEVVL